MHAPELIDLDTWPRREHFSHYLRRVPCTYAMTVEIDVTEFARAMQSIGRKTYIAQVWALAAVVNAHEEFRMALVRDEATGADQPAIWPVVHPMFTVFNPARETFAAVWTPFDSDFGTFHERGAALLAEHAHADTMFPQGEPPANTFDVSSLPWASFTGFTLNIRDSWTHLAPIFTLGRYLERAGRTLLPVSVQVHHAAADGFHTARFVNELQGMFDEPGWVSV